MNPNGIMIKNRQDAELSAWREKEKTALELLQIVGELRFDRNVELILFRKEIYDTRPSEVIENHNFAKHFSKKDINIDTSLMLAHAIANLKDIAPSKIDIGRLSVEWLTESDKYDDIDDFLMAKIYNHLGEEKKQIAPKDVVLYGFGRIGRLVARRIIESTGRGNQLRLKAIVIRPKLKDNTAELKKRASLLDKDSVHGKFHGVVEIDSAENQLIVNGNRIQIIFAKQPTDIDYTDYGIQDALVIDNTGVWRDKEGLSIHLRPGVSQVMLTAPGKGIPNIVHGVNQKTLVFEDDKVFSAASCTTNAIVPVLDVLHKRYNIQKGHLETIHAYTNDQNLLDNFHKKPRRGRGAPVNMVLTSTGAASAVAKVIPDLKGKLTGNAVRVPVPNVSIAILNLTIDEVTNVEEVNNLIKNASLQGDLVEQIHYSDDPEMVSTDMIAMTSTSVFDAPSTLVSADGKTVTIYIWYDNEYGYSCQVVRLAKYVSQVRRIRYY